jgi:nucleoside 2-deoxyribosyltransferase
MLVYLSGSIELSPDRGKAWRAELAPFLKSLGHEVYDPANDERKDLSDNEQRNFRAWKHSDLPRFQQVMRKIIAFDLDWIEHRTDYIVAYWDDFATRCAGTQAELSFAHRHGIPVYLVSAMPVAAVSGWMLGCATEVFMSFESLKAYLRERYAVADAPLTTEPLAQTQAAGLP